MRLVEQTDWNDCGAACLATVTGDSLAGIKRHLDVPTPHGQLEAYLDAHALPNDHVTVRGEPTVRTLSRQHRPFARSLPFERRTLLLSVASPARTIDWHAVVLHRGRVLDPQGEFDWTALSRSRCIWATEVYPDERPTAARTARPGVAVGSD
ncbi:hypothetical protein [Halomarina oriensis]|uniref:Peptidase C39 domain-containing protein n=1 Tax=Halomarina oriensis TaxID=671145 RepID=A0A6B0GIC9_9EURY|nr:hypothetical protein [Halomarina oriensis]MWG34622.1 hypothetical protein [Halomarina oriensis]